MSRPVVAGRPRKRSADRARDTGRALQVSVFPHEGPGRYRLTQSDIYALQGGAFRKVAMKGLVSWAAHRAAPPSNIEGAALRGWESSHGSEAWPTWTPLFLLSVQGRDNVSEECALNFISDRMRTPFSPQDAGNSCAGAGGGGVGSRARGLARLH